MGWEVLIAHRAASEEGGINIPLHHIRTIPQHMPPLTKRFLPGATQDGPARFDGSVLLTA